ncbi:hypothetical protein L3X07_03225 [Levilactobacillus brevis]|nr:hypothetical protein [Levilactobacillus brevis]
MLSTDFDVKLKLLILFATGFIVLAIVLGWLWRRDHHFSRYFGGVLGVMIVQIFLLISLALIHQ